MITKEVDLAKDSNTPKRSAKQGVSPFKKGNTGKDEVKETPDK